MRNGTARARRVMGLFGATALVSVAGVALGASAASAATITVHTKAQLAAAWHNPTTTDITLAADIGTCGTMTRSSKTSIAIHGNDHTLHATCPGTLLRQTGVGAVKISDMTLRDAIYTSDWKTGEAVDARLAAVTVDHDLFANNNSYQGGAVTGKTVTIVSSRFVKNGVLAGDSFGSYGAVLAYGDVNVQDSTFSGNEDYNVGAGILARGDVTVTTSTFTDNFGRDGGGAIFAANATITDSAFTGNATEGNVDPGAAVAVTGTLTVTASTFTHNGAENLDGGAIGGHIVHVSDSTFDSNDNGAGNGGAIAGDDIGVTRSTFHSNQTAGYGGAIYVEHSLLAVASTFDGNASYGGGAIEGASGASIAVVNSTLTGNSGGGGQGSAIYADGPLRLQFDTIAANTREQDPQPNVSQIFGTAKATLTPVRGTLVSGGAPGRDCTIATTSGGSNYDDDGTCGFHASGDVSHGANPQLGALRDNGGPTETRLPAATSPLVNAVVGTCLPHDQRGVDRPRGPACDIGSVER